MRQSFFSSIGAIILLPVVVCACDKKEADLIVTVADMVEGDYELVSMRWDGEPIDINADGIANNEILQEIMDLPTNSQNKLQTQVISFGQDRAAGIIGFRFPMQNVSILRPEGSFPTVWMIGNTLIINLSYKIERDGTLTIEHFDSFNVSEFDSRVEMKQVNNGTATFDMKGKLLFSVNYTLYDRKKEQLVTDTLHYELEKI